MFRIIFLEGEYARTRPVIVAIITKTQLTRRITHAQRENDYEV
jgi:hypothetical protein